MSEFSEYTRDSINKISQTQLSIPSPKYYSFSLVNNRIYSPFPVSYTKSPLPSPKRPIKHFHPQIKNTKSSKFKLPGIPADFKELISPFSIKTRDYSVLYDRYIKLEPEYIYLPSIKPKASVLKSHKRTRSLECPENIASKKQLTERRHN